MQYIYALVDTSKEVNIETPYGYIKYKPFYIGKGTYTKKKTERFNVHYFDAFHKRDINPHKERKIRKLLKANNFSYEIVYNLLDENLCIDKIEIELIEFLGRKCVRKNGILTNISPGGTGGYVWKDNPVAVKNIKNANKDKWKGDNNPNSSKNRKLEDTPSHKLAKEGNHWNKNRFRQLYEIYSSDNLLSLGVFNSKEIFDNFDILISTLGASIIKGKRIKNKFYIRKINSDLRIRLNPFNKMLVDGIVRSTCIIHYYKEYVEIDRNSLSPQDEE